MSVRVVLKKAIETRIYSPIHVHVHRNPPASECPYYKIMSVEKGGIALCDILRRPLTIYETEQCSRYWRECPYHRPII